MKNNKININRPQLSSEEILARRNFDEVLKQYKTLPKPFYKTGWFAGTVGLATVTLGVAGYLLMQSPAKPTLQASEKPAQTAPANFSAEFSIKPPLGENAIPYQEYAVASDKESEISCPGGTLIKVPAKAFVDVNGKPVTGKVTLAYREYRNPAQILLSGIPMTYDSAGSKYQFESAGMFDIQGECKGEKVAIAPGKQLTVMMASQDKSSRFSQYWLDTTAKNWVYLGQDVVVTKPNDRSGNMGTASKQESEGIPALSQDVNENIIAKDIVRQEPAAFPQPAPIQLPELSKPIAPRKADKSLPSFRLDVDKEAFPELAAYQNVKFEIGAENKNVPEGMDKVVWEDAQLDEGKTTGSYQMTLVKGKTKVVMTVYPVFEGKDLEKAENTYKTKLAEYKTALAKRQEDERRQAEEMQKARERAAKEAQANLEKSQKAWREQEKERMKTMNAKDFGTTMMYRTFSVASFGVYNSDCRTNFPEGQEVSLTLKDPSGKSLKNMDLFHIEKGRNSAFKYYAGTWYNFQFDPRKENLLIIVGYNKELLYADMEEFARAAANDDEIVLTMKPFGNKAANEEDIMALLNKNPKGN